MICSNCNKEYPDSQTGCPYCEGNAELSPAQTPAIAKRKPTKAVIITICLALLLAATIGAVLYFTSSSPEKVAKEFMEALEDGDYKAMGDLLNEEYVEFQIEGYSKTTAEQQMKDRWEYYIGDKCEYEIVETTDLNDEIERYQSDIFSHFEGGFNEENLVYSDAKITDCCEVVINYSVEKNGEEKKYVIVLTLIKTEKEDNWAIGHMYRTDYDDYYDNH